MGIQNKEKKMKKIYGFMLLIGIRNVIECYDIVTHK